MKVEYTFHIPGEPVRVFKGDKHGRETHNSYTENKTRYYVTMVNQFEDEEIITEPIEATFTFFMPHNTQYLESRASLVEFFNFVNKIMEGLIYKVSGMLYRVNLVKKYSENPHTEIYLKLLKEEYRGKKREKRK